MKPSRYPLLRFEGNSAHSSGFWWASAGMIYFGGKLFHTNETTDELPSEPSACHVCGGAHLVGSLPSRL